MIIIIHIFFFFQNMGKITQICDSILNKKKKRKVFSKMGTIMLIYYYYSNNNAHYFTVMYHNKCHGIFIKREY